MPGIRAGGLDCEWHPLDLGRSPRTKKSSELCARRWSVVLLTMAMCE